MALEKFDTCGAAAQGIVGLQLMGYASWVSNVFYGSALVIAITVSTIARSRVVRQ